MSHTPLPSHSALPLFQALQTWGGRRGRRRKPKPLLFPPLPSPNQELTWSVLLTKDCLQKDYSNIATRADEGKEKEEEKQRYWFTYGSASSPPLPFQDLWYWGSWEIKRRQYSRSLPNWDHTRKKKSIMQQMLLALLHGSTPAQNTSKKAMQLSKTSWLNSPFSFRLGFFWVGFAFANHWQQFCQCCPLGSCTYTPWLQNSVAY